MMMMMMMMMMNVNHPTCSKEFRSLTIKTRHAQRRARERTTRIPPIASSLSGPPWDTWAGLNRYSPEEIKKSN
jgi:hypothetical protein